MTKVLVTGGAGFIGSALCKELHTRGFSVVSVDNYFNGSKDNHHEGVEYYELNTREIGCVLNPQDYKYIFHLGEYARVEQSFEDYEEVIQYNLLAFPYLLDFAKRGQAKVIYAGSSTKFSVGDIGSSMSPYAYTKAQNTELLKNYDRWFGLDYSIAYFYNVYGRGEKAEGKYATVVAKFLNLKSKGEKVLPVTAPGTQLRNFTHIDDIVDALILIALKGYKDDYSIGADEKYSIIDLVTLLGLDYKLMPAKPGNRADGLCDSTNLKLLGWKPKHTLKGYIQQ